MASTGPPGGGVAGTVDAFNFIRRVRFPATPEVVSIFSTMMVLAVILALPFSGMSLESSLAIALAVFILPGLVGEFLNSTIFLRGDPVLNFRRLMGMELVSWWGLLIFLPASSLLGGLVGDRTLWVGGFLIALTASLPVRFLTLFAMARVSLWRKLLASVIVPAASLRVYAGAALYLSLQSARQIYLEAAILLSCMLVTGATVFWIIRRVERAGSPSIGDSPMGLFRDFLQHWLKSEPEPLEQRLAVLGVRGKIDVSILAFEGSDKSTRASVIVSNFHPGPYRDLGSGGLPSKLKASIESSIGSIALVPHGISNHEYNIISQHDIRKLIDSTESNYPKTFAASTASPLVREVSGEAKASAQAFGNSVLLTLTLAPKDMEDIPLPVLEEIDAYATEKGLHAVAADAHNSLTRQTSITPEQATMLTQAATRALDKATQMTQSAFRIGAASDLLAEFGIEDGIGPGGLSVITVETQGQLAAYITIDGNNMETGFRETILSTLKDQGIEDGEIMTTDTHLVAGVVRSRLGYYPVGEGINKKLLLTKIRENLNAARNRMQYSSAAFSRFSLDLQVLGSSSFQTITSFVGIIARRIGRSFFRLQIAIIALSLILLVVL